MVAPWLRASWAERPGRGAGDSPPRPGTASTAGAGPFLHHLIRPEKGEDRDGPRRVHATRLNVEELAQVADHLRADWTEAIRDLGGEL